VVRFYDASANAWHSLSMHNDLRYKRYELLCVNCDGTPLHEQMT
jgi:hypothetical protein